MVPDRQFGVIVVANRTGASLPRAVDKAMQLGLGLQPPPRDTPPATPITEQEMSAYVGVYSQGRRQMEVIRKAGKLVLKEGHEETELKRVSGHRFTSNLYFSLGTDGRASYLHSGGRAWRKIEP